MRRVAINWMQQAGRMSNTIPRNFVIFITLAVKRPAIVRILRKVLSQAWYLLLWLRWKVNERWLRLPVVARLRSASTHPYENETRPEEKPICAIRVLIAEIEYYKVACRSQLDLVIPWILLCYWCFSYAIAAILYVSKQN